ncbi:MAG: V-type ATP synthase subunit A [Candidatus Micrarchaeales archaeon]
MGIIEKIAGPLVVANTMIGSSMYDVVRVGKLRLIGEVIQLKKDKAVIQVYEDTAGLRPGEEVVSTGLPLSVELAPGILGKIYDGVQRPLDSIEKISGSFISRGIEVSPLDKKKKWKFVATAKKGSKVSEGNILGYVQETELIKHYIMVPQGITGTIDKIKEGNFTIEEEIAVLKSNGKNVSLNMIQKRSVRKPSDYKQKFRSEEPLMTGQRVVDTFFPVAKGGTAAVPGPFGSGKCVSGDTPVLLSDGSIKNIQDIYNSVLSNNEGIEQNGSETIIKLKEPLGLFSLQNSEMTKSSSMYIYKGMSDSLMEVKTRTGRIARITPVHKLFRITEDGDVVETMSKELKVGQFIASVRKFDSENKDAKISMTAPLYRGSMKHIKIPEMVTPELAEFIGYYVSEGYIRAKNTVVFTNSESVLLERFMELAKWIFGVEGKIELQKDKTPNVLLHSKALVDFIKAIGSGENSKEKQIPAILLKSSNTSIAAFFASYYIGDGSYYDGQVEFTTASSKLSNQISYVLTRFGIISSSTYGIIDGTPYYRIFTRGKDNLNQLYELMSPMAKHIKITKMGEYANSRVHGGSGIDVLPLSPEAIKRLYQFTLPYAELKKEGVEIHNCIGGKGRMGAGMFKKFTQLMFVNSGNQQLVQSTQKLGLSLDYIYCDEIVSIEETHGPFEVYDVTVPEYGSNFVGGQGAILLHNTVIQHQLAKYSDADLVVYVGCGERGNEMTEVLVEFPHLLDPKTNKPLIERTVLIANTSNMPVAAREASIYTGITIAEYFRDMGYNIALMADSTSRWAEAMREISARLEEMPGEEAYPAYLPKRLAEFYERAGKVESMNGKIGSITIIGAVSPAGGDISEPVSQGTLRVTKTFWALDASLANSRHFPSINWLNSYSLYLNIMHDWYVKNLGESFVENRKSAMSLLQRESELKDIVQLVGADALPDSERIVLEIGRMIREDFLRQSAFDAIDAYTGIEKQKTMLDIMLHYGKRANEAVKRGVPSDKIISLKTKSDIARMKEWKEADFASHAKKLRSDIDSEFDALIKEEAIAAKE